MAFYGYKDDLDYYFSSTPIQESPQYSTTPPESNYHEYYHHEYYSVNEPPDTQPQLYFPSEPTLRISYSTVEFNDPEFEEYDPTPYGGGYDQATTYGKPIPPSDITCYPRSAQKSDKLSYASPYGKDDQDHPIEPPSGIKPTVVNVENGDKVITSGDAEQVENGDKVDGSDDREIEFGNGTNGDRDGYGGEITQLVQIPYGSGLEAMDICESLFGYWPCLANKAEQERRKCFDQERRMDQWGSAADYLFGSPLVYNVDGNYHQQDQYYDECWENS